MADCVLGEFWVNVITNGTSNWSRTGSLAALAIAVNITSKLSVGLQSLNHIEVRFQQKLWTHILLFASTTGTTYDMSSWSWNWYSDWEMGERRCQGRGQIGRCSSAISKTTIAKPPWYVCVPHSDAWSTQSHSCTMSIASPHMKWNFHFDHAHAGLRSTSSLPFDRRQRFKTTQLYT